MQDPTKDGIRFHIVSPEPEYAIIHRQILGKDQLFSSYTYDLIPGKDREGYYRVCVGASDSLFQNAALAAQQGEQSTFGSIFQQQDYSKLAFEVSVTLERVFKENFLRGAEEVGAAGA